MFKYIKILISFEGLAAIYLLSGLFKSALLYYGIFFPIDFTLFIFLLLIISFFYNLYKNNFIFNSSLNVVYAIVFWLFFYLWISFTLIYTPSKQYSYTKVFKFLTNIVFIFLLLKSDFNIQRFLRIVFVLIFLFALIYFPVRFRYLIGNYPRANEFLRSFVIRSTINFSIICGVLLMIFITSTYDISNNRKIHSIGLFFLGLFVILIGSRGAILFLLITFLCYILLSRKFKLYFRINIRVLTAVVITVGLTVLLFRRQIDTLIDFTIDRFQIIIQGYLRAEGDYGHSINTRFELMRRAFEVIFSSLENFFFGTGIGSFGLLFSNQDIKLYPHNFILEIWCELGFVGIIIFSIFLIIIFYKINLSKTGINIFPMIFLFLNMFKSLGLEDLRIFYIFSALYLIQSNFPFLSSNSARKIN